MQKLSRPKVTTLFIIACEIIPFFLVSQIGMSADLASNLGRVQSGLLNTILPAIGTIGIIWGAISFVSGNPAGRGHLTMGVIGLLAGFIAPSLVHFIQSMFPSGGLA